MLDFTKLTSVNSERTMALPPERCHFKTRMTQPDGTLKVSESDDTKHIIRDIIKESNIKDMVKEGKAAYKQAKKDGSLDKAKDAKKCPKCGAGVKDGQRCCSECGTEL